MGGLAIFNNIKGFFDKIQQVENNLSTNTSDFMEIYNRNIELEQEIKDKTEELNKANNTIRKRYEKY